MMLYVVAWMIAGYVLELIENFWQFLSYWAEGVMVVYFIFAFGVALHGLTVQTQKKENSGINSGET